MSGQFIFNIFICSVLLSCIYIQYTAHINLKKVSVKYDQAYFDFGTQNVKECLKSLEVSDIIFKHLSYTEVHAKCKFYERKYHWGNEIKINGKNQIIEINDGCIVKNATIDIPLKLKFSHGSGASIDFVISYDWYNVKDPLESLQYNRQLIKECVDDLVGNFYNVGGFLTV